ncbi:hypothetical protein ACX9NE_02495 [Mycobacterium sp. ML4]
MTDTEQNVADQILAALDADGPITRHRWNFSTRITRAAWVRSTS